jgi:hypothetical protein
LAPWAAAESAHRLYERLRTPARPEDERARALIDRLWPTFAEFADDKFWTHFPKNPFGRFWELYLGCALLSRELRLVRSPNKGRGPDLKIALPDGRIVWVEATAPEPGDPLALDTVPEDLFAGEDAVPSPDRRTLFRITNSTDEKTRQRKRQIAGGFLGANDVYVLAINPCQIPDANTDPNGLATRNVLYGVGGATVRFVGSGRSADVTYQKIRDVAKMKGDLVSVGLFHVSSFSWLSAVVHSIVDPWNPEKTPGSRFVIFHNPLARQPLLHGVLPSAKEIVMATTREGWQVCPCECSAHDQRAKT